MTSALTTTKDAYTIFAPTNAAIDSLGADKLAALENDLPLLTKVRSENRKKSLAQ
jgi:uncharacterized surface protein with fasciclin (FAS1) repeats